MNQSRAEAADVRIRAMLEAFAGPDAPTPSRAGRRRRATRRTVVLTAAAVAVLGLAVPGSLALLGGHAETPKQFFGDRSQPANAKKAIRELLRLQGFQRGRLVAITNVLTARTPAGEMRVYALRFTRGYRGTAVVSSRQGGSGWVTIGSVDTESGRICPPGWTLRAGGGESDVPGRTYSFVDGRVSARVASLHVLYPHGVTAPAAVGGGYFLAWIRPRSAYSNVTLVAENAAGLEIGRLVVGGNGAAPPRPGVPDALRSCG